LSAARSRLFSLRWDYPDKPNFEQKYGCDERLRGFYRFLALDKNGDFGMSSKHFEIDEARQLIPTMRQLLRDANDELTDLAEAVATASEKYQHAESDLDTAADPDNTDELRNRRKCFESAIEELSNAQHAYVKSFNHWVEKITSFGVILRDLREGLLDFPAREKGFDYLLCWRVDENDIAFWHLERDGFVGRKPIAALLEYC
jgi:hypothetical protein